MKRRTMLEKLMLLSPLIYSSCAEYSILKEFGHSCTAKKSKKITRIKKRRKRRLKKKVSKSKIHQLEQKSIHFNQNFIEDIYLTREEMIMVKSIFLKFKGILQYVGYGHFNIVSWDEMLRLAQNYSRINAFSAKEIYFLEKLYYRDASVYGFMGKRVFASHQIAFSKRNIKKIPYTGHYLLKDRSYTRYRLLRKEIGTELVLTSGVRGVPKQFYLFLRKALLVGGNLSMASRSIAPPGHSYHGAGDFDIGKVGLGNQNFTNQFARTNIYKKLIKTNNIDIRYAKANLLGVRFEPWHIKIT